jgi:hypothetical protein
LANQLVSLKIPDVSYIWIWQVKLCQIVGDELFFTWHIFLEVGKAQDLPSKIWQTLGDALIRVSFDVICL